MELHPINFSVPAIVFRNLSQRASAMNVRPAEYARRLFEAAYAARVAAERGDTVMDRSLDVQVRQVFLLADCEPNFIAEALDLPVERVERILAGWRHAAKAKPGAAAAALETKPAEPAPEAPAAPAKAKFGFWPVETVRRLWAEGKTADAIAKAIGKSKKSVETFASKNRDICPKRIGS